MKTGFAEQVSAVSPLNGQAIDGSERPKPRRDRKPPREPMDGPDRWSGRQCTWCKRRTGETWRTTSLNEYADHLAKHLFEIEREITSDPDLELAVQERSGIEVRRRGIAFTKIPAMLTAYKEWLEALTDEELRSAQSAAERLRKQGEPVPEETRVMVTEYRRRLQLRYRHSTPAERAQLEATRRERATASRREEVQRREELLPAIPERRAMREARLLTMRELADEVGVCPQLIHQWENGHQTPGWENLPRYLEALKRAPLSAEEQEKRAARKAESRKARSARAGASHKANLLARVPLPPVTERAVLRKARGLTQRDLEAQLGVCRDMIRKWEHGQAIRSPEVARRYADALGWRPGA